MRVRSILDGALIALLAICTSYAGARIGLRPRDPQSGVAIVFAPWTDARTAMTRAVATGSRFVRYGNFPFIVIVVPDAPDFSSQILAQGAFLVADPQALAACLSILSQQTVRR